LRIRRIIPSVDHSTMMAVSTTFQAVRLAGAAGPRPRRVAPFAAASATKITSNPRAALSSGSSRRAAAAAAGLRVSTCKGFNNVRFVSPRTTPHFPRSHLGNLS
jgi:hypothetical protein